MNSNFNVNLVSVQTIVMQYHLQQSGSSQNDRNHDTYSKAILFTESVAKLVSGGPLVVLNLQNKMFILPVYINLCKNGAYCHVFCFKSYVERHVNAHVVIVQ